MVYFKYFGRECGADPFDPNSICSNAKKTSYYNHLLTRMACFKNKFKRTNESKKSKNIYEAPHSRLMCLLAVNLFIKQ